MTPRFARRAVLAAIVAASILVTPSLGPGARAQGGETDAPIIAAASDLQFALAALAAGFEADTGLSVKPTFGSSGNFARQIRQGAPYQMFLSADEDYVLDLARDGFTRDKGALYALGRIVIIAPRGSALIPDAALDDLAAALQDGRLTRFAIANPEHAPYGKRAEEALRHRGLWAAIKPRLVLGENVGQAAQFATSANTQGGIIAYALALAPRVSALGSFALIPAAWHSPLRQRMVLLKNAGLVARRFYDYLRQAPARALLRQYGFVPSGETN